jgi:hypothetical protein
MDKSLHTGPPSRAHPESAGPAQGEGKKPCGKDRHAGSPITVPYFFLRVRLALLLATDGARKYNTKVTKDQSMLYRAQPRIAAGKAGISS